jgi:hypothetical protein
VRRPLASELEYATEWQQDFGEQSIELFNKLRSVPRWPPQTALEHIGMTRGQKWDFWELYAGCCNLTRSARGVGCLNCGPPVDKLRRGPGHLALDLTTESSQALVQALLIEARPVWLHVGPPCTFWSGLSRCTALRTPTRWEDLRRDAMVHVVFTMHLLRLQAASTRHGSWEQPPGCVSWRLPVTVAFLEDHPGWHKYIFPSCAWGHANPGTGSPWLKRQGFLSDVSLVTLQRPCICTEAHSVVQGTIHAGPRRGERCSTVSGEYPSALCDALAALICRTCR